MSTYAWARRDATLPIGVLGCGFNARARARRGVRGVGSVACMAHPRTYTEGDNAMKRAFAVFVAGVVLWLTYRAGASANNRVIESGVTGWMVAGALAVGVGVGAAWAKERRAAADWSGARKAVGRARRGWFEALGVSGGRLALLALVGLAVAWWVSR